MEKLINCFYLSSTKDNINFIHLSDEIELITGYPKSDFIEDRRPIQSIIHTDYHDKFNNCLKTKYTPCDFEFAIITSENKTVNMRTSIFSKETPDHETVYYGKAEMI